MNNAQLFELMKAKIEAYPEDKMRPPSMPLNQFLQLAEIQVQKANVDLDTLMHAKMKKEILDEVPSFIGALRHVASAWSDVQFDKPETRKLWIVKQAEGEKESFELWEAIALAFYDDEVMLARLHALNDHGSNADQIQAFSDLVYIAQNNKEKIIAETELTEESIDNAAELATELGQIYAKAVVDESKSPEIRILRDKAFSIVEDAMNEIERRGHYAFRNQPDLAAKYTFSYKPVKRKKKEPAVKKEQVEKEEAVKV